MSRTSILGWVAAIAASITACGPATTPSPPPASPSIAPTPAPAPVAATPAPPVKPPPPVVPWEQSGIDWSKPPAPGPAPAFRVPDATSFVLNNKLRVVVVENRRLPIVSMQLVNRYAGATYEPARQNGLASLTADLLDEGAGRFDALGLSKQLERLGASMWIAASENDATIGVSTLSATFDDTLRLLADVVSRPRLAQPDFVRVKGDRLAAIGRRRDSPSQVAGLLYDSVLWGSHPYGRPVSGTAKTVGRLRLGDVRRFYRAHYAPRFMTLIVAGDVSAAQLRAGLERTLGRWRKRVATPRRPRLAPPVKSPPRLVVSHKPDAPQSVVRIGRVGIDRRDRRYFVASVANAVLGGSFASRLNYRLREQLGYTYGARSAFWYGGNTGSWTARTALKTANTVAGIREALAMIEGVGTGGVPATELARTKNLMIRSLPQKFERNGTTVGVFAELLEHQLPLRWYDSYASAIAAVDLDATRAFGKAQWTRDQLIIVVVGDLPKFLPGLLQLGLGPALELDAEGNVVKTHPAPAASAR